MAVGEMGKFIHWRPKFRNRRADSRAFSALGERRSLTGFWSRLMGRGEENE
jgi:hypothetical protein